MIVDYVEGVAGQTDTVLRQALAEGVRPCLMINKMDRAYDLGHEPEDIYIQCETIIAKVNDIISNYVEEGDDSLFIDPAKGNCAFGSGYFGWAVTITGMA